MDKLVTIRFNTKIAGEGHSISHYCDDLREDEKTLTLVDSDNNPLCIFQKKYIVPFDDKNLCEVQVLREKEEKPVAKKKKK